MNWTTDTNPAAVPMLELAWDQALIDISHTAGLSALENIDERLRDALSTAARHGEMDPARLAKAAVSLLRHDEQLKQLTASLDAKVSTGHVS